MIIWDGVYDFIEDVPQSKNQHNSIEWIYGIKRSTDIYLGQYYILTGQYAKLRRFGLLALLRIIRHMLKKKLSSNDEGILLINCIKELEATGTKNLNILDIGGAMGMHYLKVLGEGLEKTINKYIIVETEAIVDEGEKYCCEWTIPPEFISGFPPKMHFKDVLNIDIVFCRNALPYIGGYREAIESIIPYNPYYIILERTPFGPHQTFYTCQINIGHEKIPCQMINYDEFVELLNRCGYELSYKFLHKFDRYVDNLPPDYRPSTFADLIFIRKNITINQKKVRS